VTATGQAEVVARDLQPLVVLGRLEHSLQQRTIVGLEPVAVAQGASGVLHPRRQRIADGLQLAEIERSRARRGRGDTGREGQSRKGLRREGGQLPLQTADLTPQLDSRKRLAAADERRETTISLG
jgi:hypothetical protein